MSFLIIPIVLAVVLWRFRKGFWPGLACSTAFLVLLPKQLAIPLGGALPALTAHRLIVLVLFINWMKQGIASRAWGELPFKRILLVILFSQIASTLFAEDIVSSLKTLLYFGVENFLYFVIVVSVMRDHEDAVRIARAVCVGLLGVAIIAFLERYKGYSPMQYFDGYYYDESSVMSTYSHRILLGAAMAMAWPLCMVWIQSAGKIMQRGFAWMTLFLCVGACFFAHSRGPWISMVLVGMTLGVLGSGKQRKRLAVIGCLAVVVLAMNSGVRDTIINRSSATFDPESAQAQSYQWRWELWRKAWAEISESPIRMVMGYGPGASEALNWEGQVSFEKDMVDSFASWDNTWAAYMLECGVAGFAVLLCFYGAMMWRMFKSWRIARGPQRDLATFLLAALIVYVFMQINVKIFAPQLDYIFWTTLAAGIAIERDSISQWTAEETPAEPEPLDEAVPGNAASV